MNWLWHKHPSVYIAFTVWCLTGFMGHPTIASGMIHVFMTGPLLALLVFTARMEGRHQ